MKDTRFDYDLQCWIVDDVIQRCGHPENMACNCYGRAHAGEQAIHNPSCPNDCAATLDHSWSECDDCGNTLPSVPLKTNEARVICSLCARH